METLPSTPGESLADDTRIDLSPVMDEIRELRDSLASYQGLEHSILELAKTAECNHNELNELFTELRDALEELTEIARSGAKQPTPEATDAGTTHDRSWRSWGNGSLTEGWSTTTKMAIVVFTGVLLTGWSIRAYVKTGNPYIAMLGLFVVNIAGVIAIVARRQRSVC